MQDSSAPSRNERGQLLPGNTANPDGNNGHLKGWQRYGDRIQKWLQLPISELRQLVKSPETINGLSTIDAICLRHISGALKGFDIRGERESLLDRIEGKPKQTTVLQNPDGGSLHPTIAVLTPADGARAYQDMLKRTTEG